MTTRERLTQLWAHATSRLVATALVLLATPITLAVPAAADPTVPTRGEVPGSIAGYHPTGDELFSHVAPAPGAPDALAHGASTTGGLDGRRPGLAFPATSQPPATPADPGSRRTVVMFRTAAPLSSNALVATLAAGSRLFGSHVPVSPVDGSSPGSSTGVAGVLTLPWTDGSAAAGTGQPPPPPYGRRATWTFRTPLTRPG